MRLGSRRVRLCLGVCIIMKSARVSLSVVCTLVLWAVALVSATDPFQWDSCGNKDDRLRTPALTMSSPDGKWGKGELASIDAKGDCNLNGPLKSGSWAINVYELGNAHPVDVQWGDLTKAVTFCGSVLSISLYILKAAAMSPAKWRSMAVLRECSDVGFIR